MARTIHWLRSGAAIVSTFAAITCYGAVAQTPDAKTPPAKPAAAKAPEEKTYDVYFDHADGDFNRGLNIQIGLLA